MMFVAYRKTGQRNMAGGQRLEHFVQWHDVAKENSKNALIDNVSEQSDAFSRVQVS